MGVAFTLKAKGPVGTAARVGTIASRFGPRPTAMLRRLEEYRDLAARFGTAPTLPITASVLTRHAFPIRSLADDGVEFAIHGLVHNDHVEMELPAQVSALRQARRLFDRAEVPTHGFRAPYLRANDATIEAVRTAGLVYDSSNAYAFPVPALAERTSSEAYKRALALYEARPATSLAVRPRLERGLVRIPVALPDDEMLVDRLGLTPEQQSRGWISVLEQTHRRRDLFTVMLHPERMDDCRVALTALLEEAASQDEGVWLARLEDIGRWWSARGACHLVAEDTPTGFSVRAEGPAPVQLLLRRAGADLEEVVQPGRCIELAGTRRPLVGLAPTASSSVADFLADEGYLVDRSAPADACGAYLTDEMAEDEMAIRESLRTAPGPLVRIAPWPVGYRSALALTGDVDSLTVQDFALRLWETRKAAVSAAPQQRTSTPPAMGAGRTHVTD